MSSSTSPRQAHDAELELVIVETFHIKLLAHDVDEAIVAAHHVANAEQHRANGELVGRHVQAKLVRFDGPPRVEVDYSNTRASMRNGPEHRNWVVQLTPPPGHRFGRGIGNNIAVVRALLLDALRGGGRRLIDSWSAEDLVVVEVAQDLAGMNALRDDVMAIVGSWNVLEAHATMRCRRCGCSDDDACVGGCSWVVPNLCSQCGSTDGGV